MGADRRAMPRPRSRSGRAKGVAADYAAFASQVPQIKIMLASYFGALGSNREVAFALPVAGLHLDLVRAPGQSTMSQVCRRRVLLARRDRRPQYLARRICKNPRPDRARRGQTWQAAGADRTFLLIVACADRPRLETLLDSEAKSWLAFAIQKIEELAALGTALDDGRERRGGQCSRRPTPRRLARKTSPRIRDKGRNAHLARDRVAHAPTAP